MKYKNGNEFLNSLYQDMHMEDVIMHTADKSDSPTEKIGKYLDSLETVKGKDASKFKEEINSRRSKTI